MAASLRERQSFYQSLAELTASGVTFPAALEKLERTARGALRRLIGRLHEAVGAGQTVGGSFQAVQPEASALEAAVIAAADRSGRPDDAMRSLAEYFGALADARGRIVSKSLYPVFLVHLGAAAFNAGLIVEKGAGPVVFLFAAGKIIALFWAAVVVLAVVLPVLNRAAAGSAALDGVLRVLPVIGPVRRAFSAARFCLAAALGLDAGMNAFDAWSNAGLAAQSGVMLSASRAATRAIRDGGKPGETIAGLHVLPDEVGRALVVGEETGRLVEQLREVARSQQADAMLRLDRLIEWLPRMIYFAVLVVIGVAIVKFYAGYYRMIDSMMDF